MSGRLWRRMRSGNIDCGNNSRSKNGLRWAEVNEVADHLARLDTFPGYGHFSPHEEPTPVRMVRDRHEVSHASSGFGTMDRSTSREVFPREADV